MSYYVNNLLTLLAIFAILGLSFNLIMGYAGQFSIAHGAFFGMGSYTTAVLMRDFGWSFIPAMIAAAVTTAVVSLMIGLAARRVADVYLVILTLAWQVAAVEIFRNLEITGGSGGLFGIPRADVFGIELTTPAQVIALCWVVLALVFAVIWLLVRSPFGRTLTAIREDETATRSLGKPTGGNKVKAFALSSSIAAIAGALFAIHVRFISPAEFGLDRSIEVLSLTIIGGLATLSGPLIGAAVVVIIPELLTYLELPNTLIGAINALMFSAFVIAFLLFRPQGIAGRRRSSPIVAPEATPDSPDPSTVENAAAAGDPAIAQHGDPLDPHDGDSVDALPVSGGGQVLRCEGVSISFGGVHAVRDVSLTLRAGTITGLVGPNGAGKTTLFNLLTGLLTPDEGRVYLGEVDITRRTLDYRARAGVVRSFQEMRLFDGMSARDNLLLAMTPVVDERIFGVRALGHRRRAEQARDERAGEMLTYLGLSHHADTMAVDLSYAEQKMLMIGRLLGTDADVYLLDEPMSGLDASGRRRIMEQLRDVAARGSTICLVEHSLDVIRSVCSRVAFLADGTLIREGETEVITSDDELAAMYFGR